MCLLWYGLRNQWLPRTITLVAAILLKHCFFYIGFWITQKKTRFSNFFFIHRLNFTYKKNTNAEGISYNLSRWRQNCDWECSNFVSDNFWVINNIVWVFMRMFSYVFFSISECSVMLNITTYFSKISPAAWRITK